MLTWREALLSRCRPLLPRRLPHCATLPTSAPALRFLQHTCRHRHIPTPPHASPFYCPALIPHLFVSTPHPRARSLPYYANRRRGLALISRNADTTALNGLATTTILPGNTCVITISCYNRTLRVCRRLPRILTWFNICALLAYLRRINSGLVHQR